MGYLWYQHVGILLYIIFGWEINEVQFYKVEFFFSLEFIRNVIFNE